MTFSIGANVTIASVSVSCQVTPDYKSNIRCFSAASASSEDWV